MANAFVRNLIVSTIGLPPTSFDATVALLTLIGLGAWCVFIFRFGFLIFKDRFMEDFSIFHFISLVLTLGLLIEACDKFFTYWKQSSELVKFLAYSSDYYPIPNYMKKFPEWRTNIRKGLFNDSSHTHQNSTLL
ncbi:hypothetical protein [Acinetobacter baumannii]|uniref:hypothetical protein n=1 Tax=Acinetobacter baumannii TaxID=470 RepID=UPI003F604E0F